MLKPAQQSSKILNMDIPCFAKKKKDKYEKKNGDPDKYLCMYGYGFQTLHTGASESLYRTVNALLLAELTNRSGEYTILDLGCGVGRTLYDCAPLYPNSLFVGTDLSKRMLSYARKMLRGKKPFTQDVTFTGIGKVTLSPKYVNNVILAQGSALRLPFQDEVFDVLINTYLIDRVSDPSIAIKEMARVLKRNGIVIFTDPLNGEKVSFWNKYPKREQMIQDFKANKFLVEEWFDGMIFRQMKDVRGNYSDWNTLVIKARKK